MQLAGYIRDCGKRNGGIRSVALVQADAVLSVEYDNENDRFTGITLRQGYAFATFRFNEDQAAFTEKTVAGPVGALVTHTLSFALGRLSPASARAVEELAWSSPDGFVAIVTTNNDVSLLAGYSRRFGLEFPLRFQAAAGTSGLKLTDVSAETVTLRSADTEKSKAYAGKIPL